MMSGSTTFRATCSWYGSSLVTAPRRNGWWHCNDEFELAARFRRGQLASIVEKAAAAATCSARVGIPPVDGYVRPAA